jgi:hypothetical protein
MPAVQQVSGEGEGRADGVCCCTCPSTRHGLLTWIDTWRAPLAAVAVASLQLDTECQAAEDCQGGGSGAGALTCLKRLTTITRGTR